MSFIVLAYAGTFKIFIVAMIIVTFAEMIMWPAIPTLANELAPKGREGFYQGIVNSTATIGRMIGPLAGGILADLYGMQAMLLILTALMLIAFITTILYDRPLKKAGYKPENHS